MLYEATKFCVGFGLPGAGTLNEGNNHLINETERLRPHVVRFWSNNFVYNVNVACVKEDIFNVFLKQSGLGNASKSVFGKLFLACAGDRVRTADWAPYAHDQEPARRGNEVTRTRVPFYVGIEPNPAVAQRIRTKFAPR